MTRGRPSAAVVLELPQANPTDLLSELDAAGRLDVPDQLAQGCLDRRRRELCHEQPVPPQQEGLLGQQVDQGGRRARSDLVMLLAWLADDTDIHLGELHGVDAIEGLASFEVREPDLPHFRTHGGKLPPDPSRRHVHYEIKTGASPSSADALLAAETPLGI